MRFRIRIRVRIRLTISSEKEKGGGGTRVPSIGGKDQDEGQVQNVCGGYGQSQVI